MAVHWEREREDIFSQVFTMLHNRSFVQNVHTKTGMEPHDQFWPSSCDTLILLDQFLLSWHSFLSCTISYFVSLEGKCHLQPKIIFEKARKKNSIFFLLLELKQMKSCKWTGTERRYHTTTILLVWHLLSFGVGRLRQIQVQRGSTGREEFHETISKRLEGCKSPYEGNLEVRGGASWDVFSLLFTHFSFH